MRVNLNGVPLEWPVSCPFGNFDALHPFGHKGADFALNAGTPVPTVIDGVVKYAGENGDLGNAVRIMDQRHATEQTVGHLSQIKVQVGQAIHQGDVVGLVGSTGQSTGAHLHMKIEKLGLAVDPVPYVQHLGIQVHQAQPSSFLDNLPGSGAADRAGDWVADKVSGAMMDKFLAALAEMGHTIVVYSAEIGTVAIIACAFGMMLAPLMGSTSGKWFGRMMGAFWITVVVRIVS